MHTKLPIVAALAVLALFPAVALGQPCDPADLFAARIHYDAGYRPWSVAIGDLDGDGVADLAIASGADASVRVLFNRGDGTFALPVSYGLYTSCRGEMTIGDLDGDGDEDLVTPHRTQDRVSVLFNNGDGTFAPWVSYIVGDGPTSVAVGDLDGDGAADLVTGNAEGHTVSVLFNNGDGTFGTRVDYAAGNDARSVAIGDLDGDGAADLAVTSSDDDAVGVMLNNGDGTFGAREDYPVGAEPVAVAIGDLDGDGDGDLVATNYVDQTVSVLLNDGDGTFGVHLGYGTAAGPNSVAIGDLNSDGVPDLATANALAGRGAEVSVLVGNGDGTFGPRANYRGSTSTLMIAIGDLNGDGAPDLATANFSGDNASVLLNRCILAPAITTQPASLLLPAGGGVAEFAVAASGTAGFLYQWRRDGVDLIDGGGVSGSTTPTLTIDATIEDVAAYDVVIANGAGEAVSEQAFLAVKPNPCPADFDGDSSLTLFDFLAFQNAFFAGCP